MMKYVIVVLSGMLMLGSAGPVPKKRIAGLWAQHWGIGVKTDVTSVDTLKISVDGNGKIKIRNLSYKYNVFSKIVFNGTQLRYTVENTVDPGERFFIYFNFKLAPDGNSMEGPIRNSRNQTDNVRLVKLKD